jgi:hypothetical protein
MREDSLALEARRRLAIEPLQFGGLEGRSFMIPRSHPVNPIGITTGEVWHYTGLGGLRGILQTSSFWASSYRTMNDPGEIEYGLDVLAEAWRSISADQPHGAVKYIDRLIDPGALSEAFDHVHLLSASREGDSLSQWRAYAGKDGVSIGLDASTPLWSDPRGLQVTSPNIWDISWVKVLYRRPVQLKRGRHFLLEILRRVERAAFPGNPAAYMTSQMYTIAQVASFKHPAYADERELRSTAMLGGARPLSGIPPVGLLRTCLSFVWVSAAKYCRCQLRRSDLARQPLPIKWPSTGRFWMRPGMKRSRLSARRFRSDRLRHPNQRLSNVRFRADKIR